MMAEPRRCELHGTALTSTGACILCERRARAETARSGRGMVWLVAGVVGVAIAAAVGFRIYLAVEDYAATAAARRDPTVGSLPAPATPPVEVATAATAATVATIETASPSDPRVDPSEARREHDRRVAEAARSVQIDLYGEGWCPSCRNARAWLDANAIPYSYRDTGNAVNQRTMRALNPRSTIPTIDIEGQVLVGFNPERMRASIRRAAEARVAKSAAP